MNVRKLETEEHGMTRFLYEEAFRRTARLSPIITIQKRQRIIRYMCWRKREDLFHGSSESLFLICKWKPEGNPLYCGSGYEKGVPRTGIYGSRPEAALEDM